ncbi:MAG: 3-oxoacyl-ACP reductase FabG [Armatimonadetes bacterium]|jgi:pteridine reductase|nr:3-oxoacyl-ACP reductase FabG [Armatimonadota bacterium]HOM82182.1 3-oxoacyl-ACP reductase family protein [Armatimonadota bacterium]HPO71917.1 3-oxoacyl-ACP reductase family protein [Armatimonadota bacterium]
MELKGKVALVTGGAVRVGRAISLALSEAGASVAVNYHHSEEAAREVVALITARGGNAEAFQADVSVAADVDRMFDGVLERFGRLDVLVNNAAIFPRTPFTTVTEAEWDQVLDINLKGSFLCALRAGREMLQRDGGKIVNIADVSAYRPWPSYIPYCVSKAGVIALTQGLAKALAPKVQVNAVAPGTVLFPESYSEEQRQRAVQPIPMGREGSPEDVARTVLFLIEGSDFITGAVIPVDGGRLIA